MNAFRLLIVLVALGVTVYLLSMLRARRIRERYIWLWVLMLIGLGVVAVFPGLMSAMAAFFGFQVASNLVLTVAAIVTFLVTVSLSGAVSDLQMSVRTLTEEVAFLRLQADEHRLVAQPDEDLQTRTDSLAQPNESGQELGGDEAEQEERAPV